MPMTLPNETDDYRIARNKLLKAEIALRAQIEEVAELRRALPKGGRLKKDYTFCSTDGSQTVMSEQFGSHDTLAIYSLMYGPEAQTPCPMCCAFLDGINGQISQITDRVSFVTVAQNSPDRLADLQKARGWHQIPMFSVTQTDYQQAYLAEGSDGSQLPILNIFIRDNQEIYHFWASEMFFEPSDWHPRHLDPLWSLWNLLDLTPQGRGDFFPKL